MEIDNQIDLTVRSDTSRLIVEAAIKRGWRVKGFETNSGIFELNIPKKLAPVRIFSAAPAQTSYVASKIADNKYIVNQLLKEQNLPVPDELAVKFSDIKTSKIVSKIKSFMAAHDKVVVKPLDSAHGKGITLDVDSTSWQAAVSKANDNSASGYILIQQQVAGVDIRIVCIGHEYVDAITRIPASVIGDGIHNIKKLIELTNKNREQAKNNQSRLSVIPGELAIDFLGQKEAERIPKPGENVPVLGISNTSMGGERKNIKEDIPDSLKEYAERAAEILDLPVCGVDFFVNSSPTPLRTLEDLNPYIIEVNWCPSFVMYEDINSKGQLALINKYLDFLAR